MAIGDSLRDSALRRSRRWDSGGCQKFGQLAEELSMTPSPFLWTALRIVTDCENERLRRIACKMDHLVLWIPPSPDFKCDRFPLLCDAHDDPPRAFRIGPLPWKHKNPGPYSARGMNPSSSSIIIGNSYDGVELL